MKSCIIPHIYETSVRCRISRVHVISMSAQIRENMYACVCSCACTHLNFSWYISPLFLLLSVRYWRPKRWPNFFTTISNQNMEKKISYCFDSSCCMGETSSIRFYLKIADVLDTLETMQGVFFRCWSSQPCS